MKLKSFMVYAIPLLLVFVVLGVLVAVFTLDNSQPVKLKYHIPFTSFHIPKLEEGKPDSVEIDVVYVILFSIFIGIIVMTFFVAFAGIGWRYYAARTWLGNKLRERKERKFLWERRENAIALSLRGWDEAAINDFESLIEKDNPRAELYIGLAEAYERKGDAQKAIENYNTVLAQKSDNMRALFGAARNWEKLGNPAEAIQLYNRVLKFEDSSPHAVRKIQELLEKSGRYNEAIKTYPRDFGNSPEDQKNRATLASLHYRLAVEQLKANQFDVAEKTLKEGRRYSDTFVPNILILANLYKTIKQTKREREVLEAGARQTLSTIICRQLEEYYYRQDGSATDKLEAVIKLYKELIESRNANHLRLALGKLYLKLERFQEAEQMFQDFQRVDIRVPQDIPQVHLLLADLYHRTEQIDKALEEYRISAQLVDIKIADFKCTKCGAMYEYWADQCTACKSWGTIEDLFFTEGPQSVLPELKPRPTPQLSISGAAPAEEKVVSP